MVASAGKPAVAILSLFGKEQLIQTFIQRFTSVLYGECVSPKLNTRFVTFTGYHEKK